jgi:hypothetical protein
MSAKTLHLDCVKYSLDDYFELDMTTDEVPTFIAVKYIFCFEGSWSLVSRLLAVDSYVRHYQCYIVCDLPEWKAVKPGVELDYHALSSYSIDVDGNQFSTVSLHHSIADKHANSI